MMLLIRNLPYDTGRIELKQLLASTLREHLFTRWVINPRIGKVEILSFEDRRQNKKELHGLVQIGPKHHIGTLVKQLDGISLRGRVLAVRRYIQRSPHDRRIAFTDPRLLDFPERRMEERRSSHLRVSRAEALPNPEPDEHSVAGYNVKIVQRRR